MDLPVAVLPDNVVSPVTVHVTNASKVPVATDRCMDIDSTLTFTIPHGPVMDLPVAVLPDNIVSTSVLSNRCPKCGITEASTSIRAARSTAASISMNADGKVRAVDDHRTTRITALCIDCISQRRLSVIHGMADKSTGMGLLDLISCVARRGIAEIGRGSIDPITSDPQISRVSGVRELEATALRC